MFPYVRLHGLLLLRNGNGAVYVCVCVFPPLLPQPGVAIYLRVCGAIPSGITDSASTSNLKFH